MWPPFSPTLPLNSTSHTNLCFAQCDICSDICNLFRLDNSRGAPSPLHYLRNRESKKTTLRKPYLLVPTTPCWHEDAYYVWHCVVIFFPVVGSPVPRVAFVYKELLILLCVGSCLWQWRRWWHVVLLPFWNTEWPFLKMCLFRNWSSLPRVMWCPEDPCLKKTAEHNHGGVVCTYIWDMWPILCVLF